MTSPTIVILDIEASYLLGFLPSFIDIDNPKPAQQQFHDNYGHGGGWHTMPGMTLKGDTLFFPGDPPFEPIAHTRLREEKILFYRHGIVCIVQPDGSFDVARLD